MCNKNFDPNLGNEIFALAEELFPINRSLTGDGVRQTLKVLQRKVPELQIHEVLSGTNCFDWTVPKEWRVSEAWIEDPNGQRIVDFNDCNLHLVGYSTPVNESMSLDQLQKHLYSLPDQPDAIPYVTSYYKERWGFCITERQRQSLQPGEYKVRVDSELFDGSLTYGELILPGECNDEIFISTYVCHPSMANNELSGPCVSIHLAEWIKTIPRRYSYRFVFVPETIGSICYLSQHHETLKQRVIAGFNLSCIGDDRAYSYLPSRNESTLSDEIAQHVLQHTDVNYDRYSFLERGSDERQYCSPGIDLPIASLMRSKYGTYPEYHTSLDDLTVISPTGLFGGFLVAARCVQGIESNVTLKATSSCEPQLGRRGLYPDLSVKGGADHVREMMNLLAYCDGDRTLLEIANKINAPIWQIQKHVDALIGAGVIEVVDHDE